MKVSWASGVSLTYLDGLVDDTIDYAKRIEFKMDTIDYPFRDLLVLFMEIIEELLA